jgi:predicted DNA-binding protein with PD1-like motif
VEKSRKGDLLVIRLRDGEDLLEGFSAALKEEKVGSGVIIGGVGMVRGAALSFYAGHGEYETRPIEEAVELCSINGNVSTSEGGLVLHIHAVVAKHGGAALGGHLSGGTVNMTAEIAVLVAGQKLVRNPDPATGLKMLGFE